MVTVASFFVLALCFFMAAMNGFDRARELRAKADAGPVARREQSRAPLPQPARSETEGDVGFAGALCFLWVFLVTGYIVAVILMLAWVAKDSRNRGVDGGAVWVMVILFTGFIGLLVYLASRPHGVLVVCPHCNNKKLMPARLCPHCGNKSPLPGRL